ncbi:MAG: prepilin peptidase [Candidatus Omnitrophica bacterium]|nr:prepilin peptidase [Candidatus Omnitrophota bacterium]
MLFFGLMEKILAFIFGLAWGSFANVCIYRLPRGRSLVMPGSQCPACGHAIPWYDNIPLLSWLILRGKCRFCQARISGRYFLVELMSGCLFLWLFVRYGFSWQFLVLAIFLLSLIIVSFIDIDTYLIPDVIVLPGILVGFASAALVSEFFQDMNIVGRIIYSGVGIFAGGGLLWLIGILGKLAYKKDAMGGGDVKLLAMIGAYLGWKSVLITIFFAALLGSIISLVLIAMKLKKMDDYIPFGPYLALGAVLALAWKGSTFYGFYIP